MKELTRLERTAVDAHKAGTPWSEFWEIHRHTVGQIEPWDNAAYRRIVARLSHIVTCGDCDGYGRPLDFELEQVR